MIGWLLLALGLAMQGGSGGGPSTVGPVSVPVPGSFILSALLRQPAAPPDSSVFVRFDLNLDKTQTLLVRAFGLPAGTYKVLRKRIDAESNLGSLVVGDGGMGKLWVEPPAVADFLDWFAFSDTIEVRAGADVLHSGQLDPIGSGGISFGEPDSIIDGARLIAVGEDLDARGRLVYRGDGGDESIDFRLERMAPGPYILEVDGQPELYVEAGKGGKTSMRLSTPIKAGSGKVTLYPAGEPVRVLDAAGNVVLAAQMPVVAYGSPHRPAGRQKFHDVGAGASDGLSVDFVKGGSYSSPYLKRGSVAWQRDALGADTIMLELLGQSYFYYYEGGMYSLYVGDTWVGDFEVNSGTDFELVEIPFAALPGLDLRGQRVEVRSGQLVHLALVFPQSVPAGLRAYHADVRKSHRLRLDLLNPGTDLDATGRVDWRLQKGVEQLQLVVQDLPAGAYDLAVGGSVVAAGALVITEAGGSAVVEFSTLGDPALPLDFPVEGALEIRAGGTDTVFLQQSLDH